MLRGRDLSPTRRSFLVGLDEFISKLGPVLLCRSSAADVVEEKMPLMNNPASRNSHERPRILPLECGYGRDRLFHR